MGSRLSKSLSCNGALKVAFRLGHLAATIHAGLQVNMVAQLEFAGMLVFLVINLLQCVMPAPLATP